MPDGTERGSAAVGVFGQLIYLAGGIQIPCAANGTDGQGRIAVTIAQSYDTVSGNWTTLPNLSVANGEGRDHGGGAVVNVTFYVVGGRNASRDSVCGTLFAMDVSSPQSKWVSKATTPTARGEIAVASVATRYMPLEERAVLRWEPKSYPPQAKCMVQRRTAGKLQRQ